ncbi:MAG: LAGLIDADG family homing endonuclease [Candidatus Bathyarchaeia archaeon]
MTEIQLGKLKISSADLFIAHIGIAGSTGSGKSREISATLLAQCIEKQPESPEGAKYGHLVVDTQCILPGQIVQGVWKPIESVRINDEVTADGSIGTVVHTASKVYEGEVINITPSIIRLPICCTPEHHVLVKHSIESERKWIQAKDLREGMFVCFPFNSESLRERSSLDLSDLLDGTKERNSRTFTERSKGRATGLPTKLELTRERMELLGLYVAEGSTVTRSSLAEVIWNFGLHEASLSSFVQTELSGLGMSAWVNATNSHSLEVRASNILASRLFKEWFGATAKEKRLPDWIMRLPPGEKLAALIRGMWKGDGSLSHWNGRPWLYIYSTASKILAIQLVQLLLRFGIMPYIGFQRQQGYSDGLRYYVTVTRYDFKKMGAILNLTHDGAIKRHQPRRKGFIEGGVLWIQVRSLKRQYYSGPVYDLQVEPVNCYALESMVVHNSEYFPFMDEYPKQVIVFSPDVTKGVPFRLSSKNITVDDIATFLREVTKKEITKSELAAIYLAVDELRGKGDYTLEQVYTKLYEFEAYSLLPAFEKIMATGIFGPEETPLALLIRPGEASILDIGGLMPEIQAIIVSHLLRRLWGARINKEVAPLVLLLEEASIFAPEEKKAPSSEILYTVATQGRGYSFLLISIFQRSSMTSKNILSQTHNWIIGKTGNPHDRKAILTSVEKIETEHDNVIRNLELAKEFLATGFIVDKPLVVRVSDPKLLAAKGGRIPPKLIESSFKREDLGSYIETIQRTEQQERSRVHETINRIRLAREQEIKGIPPKEFQKVKASLDKEKKRYEEAIDRADKRAKEKYEAKIKEQAAEIERLTKQVTLKGQPVPDILQHPLVQKRLSEKLTPQQKNLVEFLERTGPSNPEKIAAYLGCAPKTVPGHVSGANNAIPQLIISKNGIYHSRLPLIFPVTEQAKAEVKELEELRNESSNKNAAFDQLSKMHHEVVLELQALKKERDELREKVRSLETQLKVLNASHQRTVSLALEATGIKPESEAVSRAAPQMIKVEATLHRTLTKFDVITDKEVLTADESSWEGKILARGLDGFFQEPKGIGKIMAELVRRYNVGNSGGNRTTVTDRLAMLVSKGILDRKQEAGQWMYFPSPEFSERVKPFSTVQA